MGVPKLDLRERLMRTDGRPRRAAYALPTLFTAGNIFLGYIATLWSVRAATLAAIGAPGAEEQWRNAAVAIGVAAFLDGLDGRIARLTNTTSDFGREMDSLADVISFGIAPAVLAFTWGVQFVDPQLAPAFRQHLLNAGYLVAFLFLLCGAARLARFNVQVNPIPKNPGRPDRKYFVGLPIPAAAAMVAALVYAADAIPLWWWPLSVAWILLLLILSFLMISTWRYYSFKGISLVRPRSYLTIVAIGATIYLIWNWSQVVLLLMASAYVTSGIVTRVGGVLRRRVHRQGPPQPMEHPIG
jgi:CDP-diacylglycerol--serine O-phosphatidyltransferase